MSIDTEPGNAAEPKLAGGGLNGIANALVAQARADGSALTGDGGLIQRVLEGALDAETVSYWSLARDGVERSAFIGGSLASTSCTRLVNVAYNTDRTDQREI